MGRCGWWWANDAAAIGTPRNPQGGGARLHGKLFADAAALTTIVIHGFPFVEIMAGVWAGRHRAVLRGVFWGAARARSGRPWEVAEKAAQARRWWRSTGEKRVILRSGCFNECTLIFLLSPPGFYPQKSF